MCVMMKCKIRYESKQEVGCEKIAWVILNSKKFSIHQNDNELR